MILLLLEALGAGLIFVGIIWWTMFSGRKHGELPSDTETSLIPTADAKERAVEVDSAAQSEPVNRP